MNKILKFIESLIYKIKHLVSTEPKIMNKELTYTEWYNQKCDSGEWDRSSLIPPPMTAEEFFDFMFNYLKGSDYYVTWSCNQNQVHTIILEDLLYEYSPQFRKEIDDHYNKYRRDEIECFLNSLKKS